MGLLEHLIANVFDIYPNEQFIALFVQDNKLNLRALFSHQFLKLSLAYSFVWNFIYNTYPTKRDFINFVNIYKILPDSHILFDKPLLERVLNTFIHTRISDQFKNLDFNELLRKLQSYIVDLRSEDMCLVELYKRWEYRYATQIDRNNKNILLAFHTAFSTYKPLNIYEYQINPISKNYNESILFNKLDDEYLTEHEKIQYTIYKDNHFCFKLIDQIGVLCDNAPISEQLYALLLKTGTTITFNCTNKNSAIYDFKVPHSILYMLPTLFKTFIYISDNMYPEQKSLSISKDNAIYYLNTANPKQNQDTPLTLTYDRYIINNINTTSKSRINKYFIFDAPTLLSTTTTTLLCAPKTFPDIQEFIITNNITYTLDPTQKTKYVADFYNELDILNYMAQGVIPITKDNIFVKNLITGYTDINAIFMSNEVINTKIAAKNKRYWSILIDSSMFEYYWKEHLQLSCPVRTVNVRNGVLLYLNFVYLYFMRNIEKLWSIEWSQQQDNKVVLLDNRINPLSVISILFTMSNLNLNWSAKIYTSKAALDYYKSKLEFCEVEHLPALDEAKFHIDVYNNILKSSDFWRSIESTKTLIVQDDGILLRPGIERFLEYDYIGASWVDTVANEYIKNNINEDLVGNGGFSLRTNESMITVCDKYEKEKYSLFYKNITQIPEDVYFVYGLKKEGANVAKYQAGTEFSSEEVCNMNSIGLHKLWSYHNYEIVQHYFNTLLK